MVISPQIFTAKVMHKRLFPKEHAFSYGVYYLALPLPAPPIPSWLLSFHVKDMGPRDGHDPLPWARNILGDYGLNECVQDIVLITMPCVMGYVFNPVSFYLCLDTDNALRAVLCEVHNTFGEQHSYLCTNSDHSPITSEQWLEAEKKFHVSPFLPRNGHYRFRFDLKSENLGIWIDYYDEAQKKQLITSLMGTFSPMNTANLRSAFWRHPLVTLKAISLIHWHALCLVCKGIKYIVKPTPLDTKISAARHLNKM